MTQEMPVALRYVQGTKHSKSANINLPKRFIEKLGILPVDLIAIQMNGEGGLVLDKVYVLPEHKSKYE